MKRLTKEIATKDEKEAIGGWLDYYECQKIRGCFYGFVADEKYLKKAKTLDMMFEKYDSFLDKNETIYRGIRFKDTEEFNIFLSNAHKNLNKVVDIDLAPSSFTKNKNVAYNEFAKAKDDTYHSIVLKLLKRKSNELYIKDFAGKFAYQDEFIIKSHKSKFKIIDIKKVKEYNNTYEIIIEEF